MAPAAMAKKGVKKITKQEKVNIARGMATPTVFSDVNNAIATLAIIMAVNYLILRSKFQSAMAHSSHVANIQNRNPIAVKEIYL